MRGEHSLNYEVTCGIHRKDTEVWLRTLIVKSTVMGPYEDYDWILFSFYSQDYKKKYARRRNLGYKSNK